MRARGCEGTSASVGWDVTQVERHATPPLASARVPPSSRLGEMTAKALTLVCLVVLLSPPITDLWRFMLLAAGLITIIGGHGHSFRRMAIIVGCTAAAATLLHLIPRARFKEGHQYFVTLGAENEVLASYLPGKIFRFMSREFERLHPAETWCRPGVGPGCWVDTGPPTSPYAFSSDAIYGKPRGYSRTVDDIDFSDLVDLRAGFSNELALNWWNRISDVKKDEVPFFVAFEPSAQSVGSSLCWTGDVFWGERDGFQHYPSRDRACRRIKTADVGHRVFAVSARPEYPLSVQLELSPRLRAFRALRIVSIVACVSCLLLLSFWGESLALLHRLWPYFLVVGLAVLSIPPSELRTFSGYPNYLGGSDGLTYESFGRQIVKLTMSGDLIGALRGSEDVFYFMPGLRYLIALSKPIFSDTGLFQLAAIVLLPVSLFSLMRVFWPLWGCIALVAVFQLPFDGVLSNLGWQSKPYRDLALLGYAEPMGYALFLGGLALLLGNEARRSSFEIVLGQILLAVSVAVRPNLVIPWALVLAYFALANVARRRIAPLLAAAAGATPVLLVPLHNMFYGGEVVPFTSSTFHPFHYAMPLSEYWRAFAAAFLSGDDVESLERVRAHLAAWMPQGWSVLFLSALPLSLAVPRFVPERFSWKFSAVAAAALGMHGLTLLIRAEARYGYLAWALTFFLGVALVVETAAAFARRSRLLERFRYGSPRAQFAVMVAAPCILWAAFQLPSPAVLVADTGMNDLVRGLRRPRYSEGGRVWKETRRSATFRLPLDVKGPGQLRLKVANPLEQMITADLLLPTGRSERVFVPAGEAQDIVLAFGEVSLPASVELRARPPSLRVAEITWDFRSANPDWTVLLAGSLLVFGSFSGLVLVVGVSPRKAIWAPVALGVAVAAAASWNKVLLIRAIQMSSWAFFLLGLVALLLLGVRPSTGLASVSRHGSSR